MEATLEYEKQALDFLSKTRTDLTVKFLYSGKFWDYDKENRDVYEFTLRRGNRVYTSKFGQSLVNSRHWKDKATGKISTDEKYVKSAWRSCAEKKGKEPTAYDILSCLTKYNPGTFEDFCGEYGYNADSIKAKETYQNVVEEWLNISSLWTNRELEDLQEIQ